jgi:hypothetical protein
MRRYVYLGSTPATGDRSAYTAWAAAVKASGGVVTVAPHMNGNPPAARFPVSAVYPNAPDNTLGPGFNRAPDDWSDSGLYAYFVAPTDAQLYADTGMLQAGQVPGEATGNPAWLDALRDAGKQIAIGVGVALVVGIIVKRASR